MGPRSEGEYRENDLYLDNRVQLVYQILIF